MNTLEFFSEDTPYKEYKAGELIFREGEPGDTMYIIKEGAVEVSVAGEKFVVGQQGDLLGEMAMIDSSARSATALAKTDCKLIELNEKQFAFQVQRTPIFAIFVMKILVERLRKMNKILSSME
jgi:CRP/FNR family transcriptional regulator, cyclic AMP receptor protein